MSNKQAIETYKQDKQALYNELIASGGKPARNGMFSCPFHDDRTPSSHVKRGVNGYFWRCFVCGIYDDALGLEARRRGITFGELIKEKFGDGKATANWQHSYKTVEDLIASIDAVAIEEVNKYTDPDSGNLDLLVIRFIPRGENSKKFIQCHQTSNGLVMKRPKGALPLFNRLRLKDSDTIIYVEGEKCVRKLTELGFTATTGSGGSNNANSHDYSPLAGKKIILWADNDEPGRRYIAQVRDKLLELDPQPTVFEVDVTALELEEGGDVADLCEKVLKEGGTLGDCCDFITSVLEDATESNRLQCLEDLLDDMREGKYINLPLKDFPILTNEARMLLNKRIGIVFGGAGIGKTLFMGKVCDDLLMDGRKVARLQLEDEMEQHLLRSLAQVSARGELANDDYHREHPLESKVIYEQFKPTLDVIASSIVAGENDEWDDVKVLKWIEQQLKAGKELVVVDPISVILSDKVWLTSHRLMWNLKKLLAQYPNARVVLVSHPNAEGEISGGQAYKRFSHCMLMLNRFKKPKQVEMINKDGEIYIDTVDASIGIAKSRYGRGGGLEVAVKIDGRSLTMVELGIITKEIKVKKPVGQTFDMDDDEEL